MFLHYFLTRYRRALSSFSLSKLLFSHGNLISPGKSLILQQMGRNRETKDSALSQSRSPQGLPLPDLEHLMNSERERERETISAS